MFMTYFDMLIVLLIAGFCLILGSCAQVRGNVYPLPEKYLRQNELTGVLTQVAELNPSLAKLRIIGFSSSENLPIYALEIGNPQATRKVLIIGQHHGDEVLGVNITVAFARQLLGANGHELLQHTRFWLIPTLNPEGFRIVSSGTYQFKRKNNRDTDGNKLLDLRTDGVDLNRNYPVFWDKDIDTNPVSPNYKGSGPASEKEVQAVIALAQEQGFDTALFLHSSASGQLNETVFLPAADPTAPLYLQTLALAERYARMVKRDYQPGTYVVHTKSVSEVGNARNYFYHRLGCKAFLIEIGGVNQQGIGIIHPPSEMLDKITKRQVQALLRLFADDQDLPGKP